jgi:hypothetical protein
MTLAQFNRIVLCSVALLVSTATGSHAELAPDAQQAINKGIIAANQQDYLLAIRYFEEARKIALDAPERDAQGPTTTVVNGSAGQMVHSERRHSPGTLGTCCSDAPDTIRTCDLCLRGLAPTPSPAPAGTLPAARQSAK